MACHSVWYAFCYTPPELVQFHRALPQDEGGFHWAMAKDNDRHLCAREGDHLVTPFQCDICVFRNLHGRNPGAHDDLVMACIRQANLDACWGREKATVASTLRAVRQTIQLLGPVGVPPPFPALGPFPVGDEFGYAMAIAMLLKSRQPGRYANYQQFETLRKLRAGFSNVFMASSASQGSLRLMGGDKAKQHLCNCPTNSLWFERFAKGCLSRMGQIVRQDRAVSLELMHALCSLLEQEWEAASGLKEKAQIASLGAYSVVAFCGSFRGPEVFMTDLFGLFKYGNECLTAGGKEYVMIPLLGRFKNEIGDQYHLTPLIANTRSGLPVKKWVQRLIEVRKGENRSRGPAFADSRSGEVRVDWYEREILERIQAIQQRRPDVVPPDVQVLEEYGLSRSFRRGATSEARARGTDKDDVDLANRWRTFEGAKGKRPRMAMRDHYSDIRLLIPALIRFSENL